MNELIDKIELAGQFGSRDLDREIALTLDNYFEDDDGRLVCIEPNGTHCRGGIGDDILFRRYTTDLNAAVELIPQGLYWFAAVGQSRRDEPMYGVQILPAEYGEPEPIVTFQTDNSLALCICAAALRARQALAAPITPEENP